MRVAMLMEQLLSPVPGGTGRYTEELAAALVATAEDGDTVQGWTARHRGRPAVAIAGSGRPDPQATPGPRAAISPVTRSLPLPRQVLNRVWPRASGRIGAALAWTGPPGAELVFAPTPFAPPRGNRPLVVTVHDAVPWLAPQTMTARSLAWHRRSIERVARDADAILVPSEAVRAELTRHLPGIGAGRLHVTGEGMSVAVASEPQDGAQRAARMRLPPAYLLIVATLEPRKGLDIALRALADTRTGDLPLVVVGQPGWGGIDLDRESAAYGLAPGRVRTLGRLPDADLATAYARATAVLVPSREEGFGLPALEALSHGLPTLVSSAPALVELVGDAGIVTPVGDRLALAEAIAGVLSMSVAQRERCAETARARAAGFTWDSVARHTWSVFRDALDRRRA